MSNRSILGAFHRIFRKDAKAGSRKKRSRLFAPELRILFNVMNALLFILILAVSYVGLIIYLKYAYCVVLPNGYMIGYSSILNPSPDGLYKMVLREPSGEVVLRTDYMMKFIRHPDDDRRVIAKFPGDLELDLFGEELMPAVVYLHPNRLEKEDPEYRSASWPEISRGLSEDDSLGWYGIGLVYEKLKLSNKFKLVNCGTPWTDRGE